MNEGTFHLGQYGGVAGQECTSVCFLEELRFDYCECTCYPMANFDNDAASCYDRILVALASLCGRKQGIHKDVIFVHAKTLQEAEFTLKTKHGITEESYSHCTKFPIHGTGQGSTNSPTIWCFVLSELFECHSQKAYGIKFMSPDGMVLVRMTMVGFVDDSTCMTGGDALTSYQELKKMM